MQQACGGVQLLHCAPSQAASLSAGTQAGAGSQCSQSGRPQAHPRAGSVGALQASLPHTLRCGAGTLLVHAQQWQAAPEGGGGLSIVTMHMYVWVWVWMAGNAVVVQQHQ